MRSSALLADAFGRVRDAVHAVVDDLTPDDLSFRIDTEANSIAWLIWHLTRVQDHHVADVAGTDQVWISSDWVSRFGLPFEPLDTGYGHDPSQVGSVTSTPEMLRGYCDDVCEMTLGFVRQVTDSDLDRIVDTRWDPPVSLGVRLVSVIADDLQHVGQAAYVRGVVERSRG